MNHANFQNADSVPLVTYFYLPRYRGVVLLKEGYLIGNGGNANNPPLADAGSDQTVEQDFITGDLNADLRAERSGSGSGRIYTITVQCTDDAGNSSGATTEVTVPHDQGKGERKSKKE